MQSALSDLVGKRVLIYLNHDEPWQPDVSIYTGDVKSIEGTVVHLVNGDRTCQMKQPRSSSSWDFEDCFLNLASPLVSVIEVSDADKIAAGMIDGE